MAAAGYLVPRLWSGAGALPEYTLVAEHESRLDSIQDLALSPDGGTVYYKGSDTPVTAIDSRSGETLFTSEDTGPGGISVSPDGALLAVHGRTVMARTSEPERNRDPVLVLDAEDGETLLETARGARGGDTAFTADGRLLVTSVWGGTGLWDTSSGARVRGLTPSGGGAVAISSDGSLVAFLRDGESALLQGDGENSGADAEIEVWTLEGEQVAVIGAGSGPSFRTLDFQPGTDSLAAAGRRGLWMWNGTTGEALGGFDHGFGAAAVGTVDEGTGNMLVWAHGEEPVAVDLDTGAPLGGVPVSADGTSASLAADTLHLAVSADGGVLVSVGREGLAEGDDRLYVWERV